MMGIFQEKLITARILICMLVFLCVGCSYSNEYKMYCFLGLGDPKPVVIKRKIKITDVYSVNDVKKSSFPNRNNEAKEIELECITIDPFSFKAPFLNRLINKEHKLHKEACQVHDNRYVVNFLYSERGVVFLDEKGETRNCIRHHKYYHVDKDGNLVIEYPTYFPESVRIYIWGKGSWIDQLKSSGSNEVTELFRYKKRIFR